MLFEKIKINFLFFNFSGYIINIRNEISGVIFTNLKIVLRHNTKTYVYLVIAETPYDGEGVVAVFADEEKADKYCYENNCYRVEEFEVWE